MDDEFRRVHLRMYKNKEIPALLGMEPWTFARELKLHKEKFGPRIGYRWKFSQVVIMLKMYGIPFIIVQ